MPAAHVMMCVRCPYDAVVALSITICPKRAASPHDSLCPTATYCRGTATAEGDRESANKSRGGGVGGVYRPARGCGVGRSPSARQWLSAIHPFQKWGHCEARRLALHHRSAPLSG